MHIVTITPIVSHEIEHRFESIESGELTAGYITDFATTHLRKNICKVLGIDSQFERYISTVRVDNLHTFFKTYYYTKIKNNKQVENLVKRLNYHANVEMTLCFKSQKEYYVFKIKNPDLAHQLNSLKNDSKKEGGENAFAFNLSSR